MLDDLFVLGDVNMDGDVNSTDLGLLLNNFGSTAGPGWEGGDLDVDSNVSSADLGLLLNNFNATSDAAVAVPEPSPSTLLLSLLLSSACGFRRIRRGGRSREPEQPLISAKAV